MNSPDGTRPGTMAEALAGSLAGSAREYRVAEARIGLGYTAVVLEDGRTGVAYTFRDGLPDGCSVFRGLRPLAGRSAVELLALLESNVALEAGVGLACANALANCGGHGQLEGDVLEHLDLRREDRVGIVGRFGPLIDALPARVRSLTVYERVDRPTGMLRPQEEALTDLPRCDVALVTATSIINRTVDGLLDAASSCREVALLGASTPLLPQVFAGRVTLLSGVVVDDSRGVLQVVSEGGGMRQFGPYVRKVAVRAAAPRAGSERLTRREHGDQPQHVR